jgi:tetrapyrrole methylase family protein/MazG family protein
MSGEAFERLIEIMARLRAPGGCPWDRKQTLESLRPYLVEETYEALDAIDRKDWDHLAEELGDVLLQVVFQAEIAREAGLFDINDVVRSITEKLVRRHPHVFGEDSIDTADQVVERWEEIKAQEKAGKPAPEVAGLLESVPRHQPALLEAFEVGKKAAKTGFDWERLEDLKKKLDEEMAEIAEAAQSGNADHLEDEVGDLLFMATNVARYLRVHPEIALRRANAKFRSRFAYIERSLVAQGRTLEQASLEEMEALWQEAKGG